MLPATSDFRGTDRFRIRRKLGSGGMGVVYEAYDKQTDKVVALKALTHTEASHISRFKNEFRSLANVSHPNLISLYELMSDGHYWFFTMELVQGLSFLEYVRPGYRRTSGSEESITPTLVKRPKEKTISVAVNHEAATQQLDPDRLTIADEAISETTIDPTLSQYPLDFGRLRSALRQLADGLHGLHQMGKLHRDIKPSNVLVTKEGRVVILDFGLVAEVEGHGQIESIVLAGTPDYMSPEQGAQLPIAAASDWYSVGVILYQALTARLPFSGKFFDVMLNKQRLDPPPPREFEPEIPPELNDLCMKLLCRDPNQRPSGREVMRTLGHGKTGPLRMAIAPAAAAGVDDEGAPFVGRERELSELHDAFKASKSGHARTVYVHGDSGLGKSALISQFLDDLEIRDDEVVVLEGRCYERESVPYKAIDGVVDSLTKFLESIPEGEAHALVPADIHALARLFPVMYQVDCIFAAPQRERSTPDAFALRRRAFAALREMLGRISARRPLVIWIDDLQWSDADSFILLEELLRPPDAPPLLLLASFRSEDTEGRPFLQTLLERAGTNSCQEIKLSALPRKDAVRLVSRLLPPRTSASDELVWSIISEARGNPFLLEQLTSYASTGNHFSPMGISLSVMLEERLSHMPKGAKQFVETLAVAGRPSNQKVAFQAAGLSGDELPLVSSLRAAQFLRSGGSEHTIELFHDRIRETLAAELDQLTVKQIHRRLAQALESHGIDDPESLFEHYLGAGERVRAATYAVAAAKKANATLAFDRAAAFYRRALDFAPAMGFETFEMKRGLADALANAGRTAEAAETFLELARETSASRSLDFQRHAAEQLLMGGHIKEGMQVLRSVLSAAGFSLSGGPKRALISLTLRRLQILLRGLKFSETDASMISGANLFRIDLCWAVAAGLGMVDLIQGADFQSRHLLLALRAGEPYRVARAMAFEAVQTASLGAPARKRALHIADEARDLALRSEHPHAIGLSIWASGMVAYLTGQWRKSAALCEQAAEVLGDQCTGVTWELGIANRFTLSSLLNLGEVAEVSRRVPGLLSAAVEQGNILAATDLRTRMNLIWLVADDPNKAREEVIAAMKVWTHEAFHLQHYSSLVALAQIELYTGDAEVAFKQFEAQLPALRRSLMLRIQTVRIEARHLRARTAIASAVGSHRNRRLRIAGKVAKRILREGMPWANPLALLIQAGIASSQAEHPEAIRLLSEALEGFASAEMALYEAATRRRLGEMLGGDEGNRLIKEADSWMTNQRVKNPVALTRMLAPGFDDAHPPSR
jgi:tetratricopeptide (TPR) repeat protein